MKREIYTSSTLFNYNNENSDKAVFIDLVKKFDEQNPNAGFLVYGTICKRGKTELLPVNKYNSLYESVNFCLDTNGDIEVYEEMSRFMIKVVERDTEIEYCIRKLLPTGLKRIYNNHDIDYRLTASPYSQNIKL